MNGKSVKVILLRKYKAALGGIALLSFIYLIVSYFLYEELTTTQMEKKTLEENAKHFLLRDKTPATKNFNVADEQSIILMWSHPWCVDSEGIQEGTRIEKCLFTYDRKKVEEAHAIVFHHTAFTCSHVPQPWVHSRHPNQTFVWYSLETPANILRFLPETFNRINENFFNWTMSYRTDADVFYPYVNEKLLYSATEAGRIRVNSIISKKRRVALWVVRNCNDTKSARSRWKYVEELVAAGLPVDRYGKCFNNSEKYLELLENSHIMESYKFYLAFESGHGCRDYITEKFWSNSLLSGRVPVVWGPKKKDVVALAPPGSFLHTDDFKSPKDLAAYLLYLHQSTAAYRQYFAWMEKPLISKSPFKNLYKLIKEKLLCKKLRENSNHKSIKNFKKYLFTHDRKTCFT